MTTYFYSYVTRCNQSEQLVGCGDGTFDFDIQELGVPNIVQFKMFLQKSIDRLRQDNELPPLNWSQHSIHLVALNPLN